MMVSLLLYAYARGERSSRAIERRCVEDVAYRVIAAHQAPDHATIARFRVRHEAVAGGPVHRGAVAVQGGGVGQGRVDRDRRHEAARQRLASRKPRLRAARARDPQGGRRASTRPRTSSTATRAAMSCPSICRPAKGVGLRWQTPSASSSAIARTASTRLRDGGGTESPGVKLELDPEAIVARVQGRGVGARSPHQLDEHRRLRARPDSALAL